MMLTLSCYLCAIQMKGMTLAVHLDPLWQSQRSDGAQSESFSDIFMCLLDVTSSLRPRKLWQASS